MVAIVARHLVLLGHAAGDRFARIGSARVAVVTRHRIAARAFAVNAPIGLGAIIAVVARRAIHDLVLARTVRIARVFCTGVAIGTQPVIRLAVAVVVLQVAHLLFDCWLARRQTLRCACALARTGKVAAEAHGERLLGNGAWRAEAHSFIRHTHGSVGVDNAREVLGAVRAGRTLW